MELTAQCDHYNIQVRRRKIQKGLKKNIPVEDGSSAIFGVPLEMLLMKDRQVTGDNNLEVPIIFDKVNSRNLVAYYPESLSSKEICFVFSW
jgi:hypothetical protein